MKFSYSLIKKLVPAIKSKRDLINKLNLHFFEAEDLSGNVLDISIPPNRFSDAASHIGIGREVSAILGIKMRTYADYTQKCAEVFRVSPRSVRASQRFRVEVQDKNLCPRYVAQYFENIKVGPSPKWVKDVLVDCGLRPINNVVDIMNYAMLETGQPLHAFDYDKLAISDKRQATIIVRRARKGEKITTLDDKSYELNKNILVIADIKRPLAIAGIKGGKEAEVDKNTKRIVVESANFNGVNIYKSSKTLKLFTDASLRFSHNISPELTIIGLNRASQLLAEVSGAKAGQIVDVNFTKSRKKIIKFNLEKFNQFIGLNLDVKTVRLYLERLGFKINQNQKSRRKVGTPTETSGLITQNSFLVEAPLLRQDIKLFEDLAEEAIRLHGYNRLKSRPPHIYLHLSGFEDQIVLKDKIRKVLIAAGLSEVSNYTFIGETDLVFGKNWGDKVVELENPISAQLKYLRPSLAPHLLKNIEGNFRFFDEVKIFEIGKTFFRDNKNKLNEKLILGIALASKNNGQVFFELKGIIKEFFGKIGLVDYLMPEMADGNNYLQSNEVLKIESDGAVIGYLGGVNKSFVKGDAALAEIDLDALLKLVVEEHEYRPLPKYPSMMRDISILVEPTVRVGEIMQAIQEVDLKYIEDVDLIDEYDVASKRSLTFRVIFQAQDRTLTNKEINQEMEKIVKILKNKFKVQIR
ncbi:phenylalanine--tRNA ligase subunit beta [Candidatus Wolfebacteria bacterium CG1_02_39_135]|uniref:Phenylalanine--tRNA ligase beta subunit n=1 Tax=Candidatus Wolfebacteria bacterium CG1_02_39_135 TaxID=1805425 RepID=A0A1J4Y4Z2_9BACT|nr:MAG: phenylalanine--tRNA ligase subunit beta [Candidatus Wolfebacteria bacterium CG1_02_39_135]